LCKTVAQILKKPQPQWIQEKPSEQDLQWLKQEAQAEPKFDTLGAKSTIWQGYLQGTYELVCKTCPYGKVLTFVRKGSKDPTPWSTWARIFQMFGPHGWRVGFFPSEFKRILPTLGQPLGPEHVNGGYAMPCHPNTIIIYRKEEATRVLIHELFHAACCDRDLCLEEKEAETESWAELVLIAFIAKGDKQKARALFQKQLHWMGENHATLITFYNIKGPDDYVWRYTIGREESYMRLGCEVPVVRIRKARLSNRLTHPYLEVYEN
jgi:hypothetical protein